MSSSNQAYVYTTDHPINKRMSSSLAKGFGAQQLPAVRLFPNRSAIVYGILRGTGDIIRSAEEANIDYLYVDHSFFYQTRSDVSNMDFSGYFRIIHNGRYINRLKDPNLVLPSDRLNRLKLPIKPWKKDGKHIVLVPMSSYTGKFTNVNPTQWLNHMIGILSQFTDRDIIIKPKNDGREFQEVLKDAFAVVATDSNAAVEAAIAGIPVFTSTTSAAYAISEVALQNIEQPKYPDREEWLKLLSYSQFTLAEIESGFAKETLNALFE